jgi:cytochrome P450
MAAQNIASTEPLLAARTAYRNFQAHLQGLLEDHRRTPRDSALVIALMEAEEGERLTLRELTAMFVTLLFAGHETTTNLLSIGMLELLRSRAAWERLVERPELAADATEELLRYVSPTQFTGRVADRDVELDGIAIAADTTVVPLIAAANHDPDVFPDPDRIDLGRANAKQHLALGFGPHFCLGNALARLEGAISFATLARRFPDMRLASGELRFTGNPLLRRLAALPVHLGRDHGA